MNARPMTTLAKADLQWFADHGPVGWFDAASPTPAMRRRLLKAGLIEKLPAVNMRVLKFQITDAGRAALANGEQMPVTDDRN